MFQLDCPPNVLTYLGKPPYYIGKCVFVVQLQTIPYMEHDNKIKNHCMKRDYKNAIINNTLP